MNRTLHYLCAALFGAGMLHITPPLCAQSEGTDVTSQYLTNADFDTNPTITSNSWNESGREFLPDSWTLTNQGGEWRRYVTSNYGVEFSTIPDVLNSVNPPATDINGSSDGAVLMMSAAWGSTIQLGQAVSLLGGKYRLEYDAINQNSSGNIQANYFGFVPTSGTPTYSTETSFSANWQTYQVEFTANEETTTGYITIGIYGNSAGSGSNAKLAVDNIKLVYLGIDKAKLTDLITEATSLYKEGTNGAEALNSAIEKAQVIVDKVNATQTEVSAAEEALAAAILQYNYDNASAESPIDMTSFVKNPTMDTPTDWVWEGDIQNKALATNKSQTAVNGAFSGNFYEGWNPDPYTGSISQTISGIPKGQYRLVAGAFNETTNEGVYLFANEYQIAVTTSVAQFYTVDNIYVSNETLTIGLRSENNATNWMGLDNVSLYYLGYDVSVAISALQKQVEEAEALLKSQMKQTVETALSSAVEEASKLSENNTEAEISAASEALAQAISEANNSIAVYAAFKAIIDGYDANNYADNTLPQAVAEAKEAAEQAYQNAEKEDFSEEITKLAEAQKTAASYVAQGNLDGLITARDMESDATTTAWTLETNIPDVWRNFAINEGQYLGMDGKVLEHWNSNTNGNTRNISIYQTVTNMPNGVYNVSLAAFAVYQKSDGEYQRKNGVVVFANDKEIELPITWNTPNSQIYTVEGVNVIDGTLKLGIQATSAFCNWIVMDNVTLEKVDETLTLDEQKAFNAPVAATTKANYTRTEFSNEENSAVNHENLRGWQTICLPFDVTNITNDECELLPIMDATFNAGVDESGNNKPFWLYAIDAEGKLSPAAEIKANVPYLMLIPNDPDYYAEFYNIAGNITFSGEAIAATALTEQEGKDGQYNLIGYFDGAAETLPTVDGKTYYALDAEGANFVQTDFAPIASFRAFATLNATPQSAPQLLSIFGDGDGTLTALPTIKEALGDRAQSVTVYTAKGGIRIESAKDCTVNVYSIDGALLQTVTVSAGGNEFVALPAGKYIANGSVVIAQ